MNTAAHVAIAVVALLHAWFLALEMFLWRKPLGLKTFRMSAEKAKITAPLAANQGLYNGFLVVALLLGLWLRDPWQAWAFQLYGLGCVIAAGLYGAWTVNRRILLIQALPAVIALWLVLAKGQPFLVGAPSVS